MFPFKKKNTYPPERLVKDLQSQERYNLAGHYIYALAKEQFDLKKKKYHYFGEELLEDVFQESLIATVENVKNGKLKDPLKLPAYFSRIFLNQCADVQRKKASRKKGGFSIVALDVGNLPEIGEEAYDALSEAMALEEKERKTIDWLDMTYEKCLELFKLRELQKLSFEEIAKRTKRSSALNVRVTMTQCKEKIKKDFKQSNKSI